MAEMGDQSMKQLEMSMSGMEIQEVIQLTFKSNFALINRRINTLFCTFYLYISLAYLKRSCIFVNIILKIDNQR